eukprot:g47696.t1
MAANDPLDVDGGGMVGVDKWNPIIVVRGSRVGKGQSVEMGRTQLNALLTMVLRIPWLRKMVDISEAALLKLPSSEVMRRRQRNWENEIESLQEARWMYDDVIDVPERELWVGNGVRLKQGMFHVPLKEVGVTGAHAGTHGLSSDLKKVGGKEKLFRMLSDLMCFSSFTSIDSVFQHLQSLLSPNQGYVLFH